jgi:hypothetical protein
MDDVRYECDSPVVLFLAETKINRIFRPHRCYSVMTSTLPWKLVCDEHPIAVCYATASEEGFLSIGKKLEKYGFLPSEEKPYAFDGVESSSQIFCNLYANAKFYSQFSELHVNYASA